MKQTQIIYVELANKKDTTPMIFRLARVIPQIPIDEAKSMITSIQSTRMVMDGTSDTLEAVSVSDA